MKTQITAKVLSDSMYRGSRLTTLEITFPRMILAEFNTHRVFSRNSASSRAIPLKKTVLKVMNDPFIPDHIGVNRPGMSPDLFLSAQELERTQRDILLTRDRSVFSLLELALGGKEFILDYMNESTYQHIAAYGFEGSLETVELLLDAIDSIKDTQPIIHKQTINRYIEPYMWHTCIVSSTEWENFFELRDSNKAQYEIQQLAKAIRTARKESHPETLSLGQWHIPFLTGEEREKFFAHYDESWLFIAAGRCARVSYETHHGTRDKQADLDLGRRLLIDKHMSPFEHVAQATNSPTKGNFHHFEQLRHLLEN